MGPLAARKSAASASPDNNATVTAAIPSSGLQARLSHVAVAGAGPRRPGLRRSPSR